MNMVSTSDSLPMLFHMGKGSVPYHWRVWAEGADVCTEYGRVGSDATGKPYEISTSRRTCEAKNVGRSNATTPDQQAIIEAKAEWTFKIERKYSLSLAEASVRKVSPMLAPTDGFLDTTDAKGKVKKGTKRYVSYPVDVQPKLDGCRCLAYWQDDRIVLLSRGGKEWEMLDHLKVQLAKILPRDAMFDGELYRHGLTFQEITKLVKNKFKGEREKVQFHVYDVPVCEGEEKPWIERKEDQIRLVPMNEDGIRGADETPDIIRVLTLSVESEEQVLACQATFLEFGYEGLMIRLFKGIYEWGDRSKALLKVKTFDDKEFRIVDFTDGTGKFAGTVQWICELNDGSGRTFNCSPTGEMGIRAQMFREGAKYVGQLLTVKFFGYTDEGNPRFPTGKGIRPPEDMAAVVLEPLPRPGGRGDQEDWPIDEDMARTKAAIHSQGGIDGRLPGER